MYANSRVQLLIPCITAYNACGAFIKRNIRTLLVGVRSKVRVNCAGTLSSRLFTSAQNHLTVITVCWLCNILIFILRQPIIQK
jgi:hypothetical protein